MPKPLSIKELLRTGGERLTDLQVKTRARISAREKVCALLPSALAASVVSAGIDEDRLTIGVTSASWASRLRYMTETLRLEIGRSTGITIRTVRIKVVPR